MKKFLFGLFIVAIVGMPGISFAFDVNAGFDVVVSTPQTNSYYVAGNQLNLNADFAKDLVAAGSSQINIKGNVGDDLIVAGNNVNIIGNVGDDIRGAGSVITIAGNVAEDAILAGGTVITSPNTVINGTLAIGGVQVDIDGTVKGKTKIAANHLTINGTLMGNVDIAFTTITIGENASIQGDLTYASKNKVPELENIVQGTVTFTQQTMPGDRKDGRLRENIIFAFLFFVVFSIIIIFALPKETREIAERIIKKPWKSLLYGFLLYAATPIAVIIIYITIIGIPVALLLLTGYIFLYVFAGVIATITASQFIMAKWESKKEWERWHKVALIIGCSLIFALIPYIAIIVSLFTAGSFFTTFKADE